MKVALHAPSMLLRGVTHELELEVALALPLEIAGIEVALRGVDGWSLVRTGRLERTHVLVTRKLIGSALLQAEVHRFPFKFTPPSSMAPTHACDPAFSVTEARVRIRVPRFWRVDERRRFELRVGEPPPGHLSRVPATASCPQDPAFELSLASTELVAGERVVGVCSATSEVTRIELSLVSQLELVDDDTTHVRTGTTYRLGEVSCVAGGPTAFELALPADVMPSFRAETHGLSWSITAVAGDRIARQPVRIVDARAASRTTPLVELAAIDRTARRFGPYR